MRQSEEPGDKVVANMAGEIKALKAEFANWGSMAIAPIALGLPSTPQRFPRVLAGERRQMLDGYGVYEDEKQLGFVRTYSGKIAIQTIINDPKVIDLKRPKRLKVVPLELPNGLPLMSYLG